jgi:DNA helicase IV
MFVRMARFEGADASTRGERMARLRQEIEAMIAGQTPDGLPAEAAEVLRSSVARVLGLVDKDGIEANAVFCETEEDLRRVDEILSAASPGEGDGQRLDVAHYEVVLDVHR